ncbi:MAG: hypothetical protein HC877_23780 [Thioploca sp.]|nr:hypothetical protein [Thioploca sp.]
MIPDRNDYIVIMFYDGMVEKGFVESWSDEKSAIYTEENILLVIQNTKKDVKCYKLIYNTPREIKPKSIALKAKSLTELHLEKIKLEKEEARKKLTTFTPGHVEFAYDPNRTTIPRKFQNPIPQRSNKKT